MSGAVQTESNRPATILIAKNAKIQRTIHKPQLADDEPTDTPKCEQQGEYIRKPSAAIPPGFYPRCSRCFSNSEADETEVTA